MIAARTLMNATAQAARFELRFGRGRAIRAVRVYVRRRVGLVQKSTDFSAVMHARVGHLVVTDQLVLGIRIHVVLVLSLIHISEPTRLGMISYAVFCLKKK